MNLYLILQCLILRRIIGYCNIDKARILAGFMRRHIEGDAPDRLERKKMPTYISLLRYTEEGAKNIKESPARLDAAKKLFQSMGAELKQWYLVMGQYDAVVVTEGPDDETAAKLLLMIGAQGNIRTETFRAFTEDEYRKIITALP